MQQSVLSCGTCKGCDGRQEQIASVQTAGLQPQNATRKCDNNIISTYLQGSLFRTQKALASDGAHHYGAAAKPRWRWPNQHGFRLAKREMSAKVNIFDLTFLLACAHVIHLSPFVLCVCACVRSLSRFSLAIHTLCLFLALFLSLLPRALPFVCCMLSHFCWSKSLGNSFILWRALSHACMHTTTHFRCVRQGRERRNIAFRSK